VEISNGSQTLSRNEFFYDNALTTGNLTQQKNWDSTKGAYSNPLTTANSISVTNQYDTYGNRTSTIDPRGFETRFTFGTVGTVTGLYPTTVVKAFGATIQRTTTADYDFDTGLVKLIRDVDNDVNQETDYDALGRPIEMRFAANVAEAKTVTRIEYSAVDRRVIMRSDLNTAYDGAIVTVQHFDQMGRVRLDRRLEDASQDATVETNGIKVQKRYGFTLGNSYEVVSNPYRAATSGAASGESTMGWKRRTNDKIGRVVEMKTFGGATLPAPWDTNAISTGAITTSYDANYITVTEQTGAANLRVRRTVLNALNQVTRVDEQDKTYNLGTPDAPVQATTYSYNALGALVNVTQGVQTRTYAYSSLGRLTSSITPESGATSYQYDNSGNVKQKTDARSITTTFGDYDALNRPTTRSYSDGTPAVTFGYDAAGVDYSKGRLTSTTSSAASYAIADYDPFGRAKGTSVTIGSQPYTTTYTYNLRGQLKTLGYPSGRSVTTTYDITARPSTVAGTLGDSAPRTYSTGITYAADGQMQQEQLGTTTAIYNKRFYNAKNDLAEIRASTAPNNSDWNRGAIINHYSDSCGGVCTGVAMPDNNNSVRKQEIKIPGDDQISTSDTFLQTFAYDSLNRLEVVSENKNGGATQWQQTFNYDRFGNRSIKSIGTFGQDINNMQASVVDNTTTNRIYGPGETEANHPLFNYDAAGNQTKDYYSAPSTDFDRTFDAENRLTLSTAIGPSGTQNSTYVYDDMGQRVRRNINGVETWQIFGVDGQLLAEYAANTAAATPLKEYGYRRGELLVVAATTGASAPAPSSLTASPSGAQVSLSWSAASGAVNYRLERKAAGGSYVLAATTTSTSKVDTGVTAGNAYLYRVCAANAGGSCTSPFSNIALGAAITFVTDPTIVSTVDDPTGATATTIKPAHITELRTAVNAVRTLAGLPNASWTNSNISSGIPIRKEDVQDLRDRLGDAFTALGITPFSYTDPVLSSGSSGTPIRKVHITQLRQSVTSGVGGPGGGGSALDLRWLVTDQVGTPRMVVSESGTLAAVTRHDYLPFGEEILGTTGGRSTTMGYTANDNVRQKFQSKERDGENELDFFAARYYSRLPGRFISPDPLGGHSEDPQTLNRYAFVRNNPLMLTDPTGMDFYLTCTKESDTCKNGQVGKTVDGKFVVTLIKNDKDGKLVDQYGNVYTAKVTPGGVLFNGAGSQEYVLGVFQNGTSPTTIVGNGDMTGFTFNFTMSNLSAGQTAKGTFSYQGNADQAQAALERAGYGVYTGDAFNFYHMGKNNYGSREWRSPGDKDSGNNSGHFSVHVPFTYGFYMNIWGGMSSYRIPKEETPTNGDVHFGEHNPFNGGTIQHLKELTWPQ
jgi:RHS repeat-associated protein